jgi:hypothetical protein
MIFGKNKTGMSRDIEDKKIATPPMRGIGLEWTLRISGVSTILSR